MNKYKIIATDLDGTLLGTDLKLSKENRLAIKELSEKGYMVVIATGRTLCESKAVLEIPEIRYIIYSNGGAILDRQTGEVIFLGLEGDALLHVFETLSEFENFMIIHKDGKTFADKKKISEPKRYNIHETVVRLVEENCVLEEDFSKHYKDSKVESIVAFFGKEEDVETCSIKLSENPGVQTVKAWASNLEILSSESGKGSALKILADRLGVEMKDIIAIGDGDNDRQMIEMSGLGFAVKNGSEELKEMADMVICSNDEHIMKYVCEYIGDRI